MAGKLYKLNGQLQIVFKALFTLLVVLFAALFFYKFYQKAFEGMIITGVWLIITVFIFSRIIKTVEISFDEEYIIINKGFIKRGIVKYRLDQVKCVRTSLEGYFTFVTLYDDIGRVKKYSCFNTFVSTLKNNRTDIFNLNKPLIKNSSLESDTVSVLKKRVRDNKR